MFLIYDDNFASKMNNEEINEKKKRNAIAIKIKNRL